MPAAKAITSKPAKYFIQCILLAKRWDPQHTHGPTIERMDTSLENQPEAGNPAAPDNPSPPAGPGALRILRSWAFDLLFSITVSSFIILFVYQPVKVEGGSMEPGLEDQERIFIDKLVYRWENIGRGDIVVF